MQGAATRNTLHRVLRSRLDGKTWPQFWKAWAASALARAKCFLTPAPRASYDQAIGDVTYVPATHGPMALGTPGEAKRGKRITALGLARSGLIAVARLGSGVLLGHNLNDSRSLERRVMEARANAELHGKNLATARALLLMPGPKFRVDYDVHEACLVVAHRNGLGDRVRNTHC